MVVWGSDNDGQGNVPTTAQRGVIAVATGQSHVLAVTEAGGVVGWGWNGYGQTVAPLGAQSEVTAVSAALRTASR